MTGGDPFSLAGTTALVTGGTGLLGGPMCRALCRAGATLWVGGRDEARLHALCESLASEGWSARPLRFDLGLADERARACDTLSEALGQSGAALDILVHNAHGGRAGPVAHHAPDFSHAHELAVTAPADLTQRLTPVLERGAARRRGGASIIHIASMYGVVSPDPSIYGDSGLNNPPYYGAAKAGMLQLSRYFAVHLAPKGIRSNALVPGPFPRNEYLAAHPAFASALARKVPLGRVGKPDEVAGPLVFLASGASSYVTGAQLPVDGGWTAW